MFKSDLPYLKTLSFMFYATNAILVGFLPVYLQYIDLNNSQIGLVLAVGPLATILAQVFWGYLSDKFKTVKKIIQVCIVGFLVASLFFFNIYSYYFILLSIFVLFFFAIPIGALTDSLSQRLAAKYGVVFGKIRMWGSIGFCFASITAGFILYKIGINLMLALLLPMIILLFIVAIFIPDAEYDTQNKVRLTDLKKIFMNKKFILFLLFSMSLSVTQRGNDNFIGIYVIELGGNESQVGTAWSMALLGEAIIFYLSYLWFKKLHTIQFIIIASVFYCVRWFAYSFVNEPNFIFLLQLLNGPSFAIYYMSSFEYISSLLPKHIQSTGHLLFVTTFFGISGVISASIGGKILDEWNGGILYTFLGFISIISVILFIFYYIFFIKKDSFLKSRERKI